MVCVVKAIWEYWLMWSSNYNSIITDSEYRQCFNIDYFDGVLGNIDRQQSSDQLSLPMYWK